MRKQREQSPMIRYLSSSTGYSYYPPMQDQTGYTGLIDIPCFGGAHAGGLNMSRCDGSVRTISYTIDSETHRQLGNRMDGLLIDGGRF